MTVSNATIEEVCRFCRNWFDKERYTGTFTISNGALAGSLPLLTGQYFRIIGSVFNDGIHVYPASDLTDETFEGAVWAMAVPSAVIAQTEDIEAWTEKYGGIDSPAMSPYSSESFGGYSYSKSTGGTSGDSSGGNSWESAFASKLSQWRKI